MLNFGELIPAEEKYADKGRFQEEGHHAFDCQWQPENIADIMGVIRPISAKLELPW